MQEKLQKIRTEFDQDAGTGMSAEELRIKYLGKKSELMSLLANIKNLSPEEKKVIGQEGNGLKKLFEQKIVEVSEKRAKSKDKNFDNIDVTLPGKKQKIGRLHPHTLVMREMNEIFKQLGFSVYAGPEIETDEYVFEK